MEILNAERFIRQLKLAELRAISEIARKGSILAASASLGTSQPALTRILSGVESKFGVSLFERLPRGVRPTLFGEVLLGRIAAIFSELRNAVDDIESIKGLYRGSISVGAMPLAAASLLPESVNRLTTDNPGLRLEVIEGNPESLLIELRARRIDIIVGRIPPQKRDRDPDLNWEVLYQEQMNIITNNTHELQKKIKLNLKDLLCESWILPPPKTAFYSQIIEMFEEVNLSIPEKHIRTLSLPFNLGLVLRSNFISVVPSSLIALGFLPLGIKPLSVSIPPTCGPVGFIRIAGVNETPAIHEFMLCTRRVAEDIKSRQTITSFK